MVNKCRILLILLLLPLLGGCANLSMTTAGEILAPVYDICPLEGKWAVIEELGSEGHVGETNLEADPFQFSRGMVVFGNKKWDQPSYKIKKVDSRAYLMTKYIVLTSYLASLKQTVEVVTVFADANYLGEFMKINDGTVVAFVQNKVLLLNKFADQADAPLTITGLNTVDYKNYNNKGTSGVFIGLKIPSNNDYSYKTVWVAANDKKLRPVLCRKDIFFPRHSGFWELQVKSGLNQGTPGLWAHNVAIKDDLDDSDSSITTSLSNQSIAVDYISNDYVTVTRNNGGTDILQVLPVDQLSSPLGIKVADLLGDTGSKAYHSARQQVLQTLQYQGIMIDGDGSEDNFGLTRRMGHWHLQGRINYHRNGNPENMEFEINCIPPANLVFYDTLYLSWQSIRDRVPNAVDAFTSPNKDIAVIKTPSKLYFFGISGEQLDSIPLGEMSLKEGTSVIMAEWATGFYVDNWEKAFITNGAHLVKDSAF